MGIYPREKIFVLAEGQVDGKDSPQVYKPLGG